MSELRPYCISIAGFDPSAGAGVLADVKTFEQLKCYGFGVSTALTFQNDVAFEGMLWHSLEQIKKQLMPLEKFPVKCIKIGLVENLQVLQEIVHLVNSLFEKPFIVWDPVLQASAGFEFMRDATFNQKGLSGINLITPNNMEYEKMQLGEMKDYQGAILLKGGHRKEKYATDTLFVKNESIDISGEPFENKKDKHGTGCVLSSAIVAYVALGYDQLKACRRAKEYTEKLIKSNSTRLGYHTP